MAQCIIKAEDQISSAEDQDEDEPERRQMHHQTQIALQAPLTPIMPATQMLAPAPMLAPAAPLMQPVMQPTPMYNPYYGYGAPIAAPAPVVQPMVAPVPMVAPAPVMQPVMQQGVQVYDHNVISVPIHVPVPPPICGGNTVYNSLMTSCQQCPDGTTANASRTACVLAMFCGVGEVPMGSGQGCQQCQPGTHPDPTGTFCQGPPPVEVFFNPTMQPQPLTQYSYHPEQVVVPNAVTVKHDTTFQTGLYNWQSTAQPTTHWNGGAQPMMAAPVVAAAPLGMMGAPYMAGYPGMIGSPGWH